MDHKSNKTRKRTLLPPLNKKSQTIDAGAGFILLGVILPMVFPQVLIFHAEWFRVLVFFIAYIILSAEVFLRAFSGLKKGSMFDEYIMISVISLAGFTLRFYPDIVIVMLLYRMGLYITVWDDPHRL